MKNRAIVYAALITALFVAAPAFAATSDSTTPMDCSEANMTKANAEVMEMADATKKAEAMKEMDMAKEMMTKQDEEGCMMHMTKVMDMMK